MVDGKGSFSNAQVASHCLLDVNFHLHVAKRALMFLFHELVSYLKSGYPINRYVLLQWVPKINRQISDILSLIKRIA